MTIEDFDIHFNEHFESHFLRNGLHCVIVSRQSGH